MSRRSTDEHNQGEEGSDGMDNKYSGQSRSGRSSQVEGISLLSSEETAW